MNKERQIIANELFVEYLNEDSDYPSTFGLPKVGPTDGVPSADDDTKSAHQVTSDPEMLNRINAWLSSLTQRPYVNAYSVIMYLKQKLAISGLDFVQPKFGGESGEESVPVTQWGNPTSLNLNFIWVVVRGWYTISVELKGEVVPPDNIQEEDYVEEGANPFQILNSTISNRQNKVSRLFRRANSGSRVVTRGLRKSLNAGNKANHALKAAIGSGGYTHTQGRSLHLHAKALRGASLAPGQVSKAKKLTP